jgi:phosphatidate cytidylyltransferase
MRQRIMTAIFALVVLGVLLFAMPPIAVRIAIGALIVAGAWEWSGFLGRQGTGIRVLYVAVIAGLLVGMLFFMGNWAREILWLSAVWWAVALLWTFAFPTPIPQVIRWLVGVLVLLPLYVALMLLYDADPLILLFGLLIVWVADSGAYFAGRTFGKIKLAPQISPGKTWEGVIGGMLAVVLLATAVSFFADTDPMVFIPFCLAVGAFSIVGDLTVSMFKRTAGVKDSGTLFPGHGGVLDRIDSVAAAAPLFALGLTQAGLA